MEDTLESKPNSNLTPQPEETPYTCASPAELEALERRYIAFRSEMRRVPSPPLTITPSEAPWEWHHDTPPRIPAAGWMISTQPSPQHFTEATSQHQFNDDLGHFPPRIVAKLHRFAARIYMEPAPASPPPTFYWSLADFSARSFELRTQMDDGRFTTAAFSESSFYRMSFVSFKLIVTDTLRRVAVTYDQLDARFKVDGHCWRGRAKRT